MVGNFYFSIFLRLTWEFLSLESEREGSVCWSNNKIIDWSNYSHLTFRILVLFSINLAKLRIVWLKKNQNVLHFRTEVVCFLADQKHGLNFAASCQLEMQESRWPILVQLDNGVAVSFQVWIFVLHKHIAPKLRSVCNILVYSEQHCYLATLTPSFAGSEGSE